VHFNCYSNFCATQLNEYNIPHHVAIVMDGNGRWANARFLPRLAGHRQGLVALRVCIQASIARRIKILTVFAFSSENWHRPADEVSGLMELLFLALNREVEAMHASGVRIQFVGDRTALSSRIVEGLIQAEEKTCANTNLILNVCFNYGGRWDVIQSVEKLMISGEEVNEKNINAGMALAHVPDPDLFIRTGGEMRVSNFLLWQIAYAELYFSSHLWPEFDEFELDRAIAAYTARERRFGKTSEQISLTSSLDV
jgi:undecaprenyl diphosphate synthase